MWRNQSGKRSVDWKDVREYLKGYVGEFYTIASTEDVVQSGAAPKTVKASDLFKNVADEPDEEVSSEEEIITPTYKVDDTVIDKPADNIEFEEPEDDENPIATKSEEANIENNDELEVEESLTENNAPTQQPQQ